MHRSTARRHDLGEQEDRGDRPARARLEISEMGMPTWSRGLSALVGRRLEQHGGINVPIQCGGVLVHPGDLVVDDNGIVVIPPAEAEEVYTAARWFEDRSPSQRVWLQHGGSLADLRD